MLLQWLCGCWINEKLGQTQSNIILGLLLLIFRCLLIEGNIFVFDDLALFWPESTFLACLPTCRVVEIVVIKTASPIGRFG